MSASEPARSHEAKPVVAAFDEAEAAAAPKHRTKEVAVGWAEEIPVGGCKIVRVGHLSVEIFHLAEGFHALRNSCPHQGAELCRGSIHSTYQPGTVREYTVAPAGRVLRCSWHGWEFDIITGKGLYDARDRVAIYEFLVKERRPAFCGGVKRP